MPTPSLSTGDSSRKPTTAMVPTHLSVPVLNLLSRLREEPDSSDGSSADEAAPPKTAGWRGTGKPMDVGLVYTSWEICDGQGLASEERRYPDTAVWKAASEPIRSSHADMARQLFCQVTESQFEEEATSGPCVG